MNQELIFKEESARKPGKFLSLLHNTLTTFVYKTNVSTVIVFRVSFQQLLKQYLTQHSFAYEVNKARLRNSRLEFKLILHVCVSETMRIDLEICSGSKETSTLVLLRVRGAKAELTSWPMQELTYSGLHH